MKTSQTKKNRNEKKAYLALSGGVDSAVSAHLLIERGFDVTGVFMKNWSGEEYGLEDECPWKKDQKDAEAVCRHLEIPFKTYNFEKEYRQNIIEYFFDEYRKGRTPNPDILCNTLIKFGLFMDKAIGEGADYIATGHYAGKLVHHDGSVDLITPRDSTKDQTYFLYNLTQSQVRRSLFPLTSLKKTEVRQIAQDIKLPVAEKKDSQGICFLGKVDVHDFLMNEIIPKPGNIIDIGTKKKVGEHSGVWFYTNGQREGLGIGGAAKPFYVCGKDLKKNVLYVAQGSDNPALYAKTITLGDIHWIHNEFAGTELSAAVRYRQKPRPARLSENILDFHEPVWSPAPGQAAVLYHGDIVLGGGIIEEIERESTG